MKGGPLDPEMVRSARKEEIDWVLYHKVFEIVDEEECTRSGAGKLDLRWVDTRKGAGVRSRVVVRELKARKKLAQQLDPCRTFSSMPPSEC